MKKSKGFTLIELLTVIAILAIILLIAAPTILGVLDKAKKNTFKNQVLLYVESLKQQVALTALNQADINITLPDVGSSTTVNISDIPMDTTTGMSGSIRIENNNGSYKYILVGVSNDTYKINKEVEAKSLSISDIVKSDGTSSEPEIPTYQSYSIGDSVTLKDGTVWYVIENSETSSSTVTLFASSNIKNDASGWTNIIDEYKIAFDEENARLTENNSYCTDPTNGCNIYASQSETVINGSISGTVTMDSTIKKFLDGSVTNYINNSLTSSGGTSINSIRLITIDEICNIINVFDSSNNCTLESAYYGTNGDKILIEVFNNLPEWLYSTNYWTMTPSSDSNHVHKITYYSHLDRGHASYVGYGGTRPVIVTNKSNIK